MKFNLIQYKEIFIPLYEKRGDNKVNKSNLDNYTLSLPELVLSLNNNKILNPSIPGSIDIRFEDFTLFTKATNWFNYIGKKKDFKDSSSFYEPSTRKIKFFNDVFDYEKINTKQSLVNINNLKGSDFHIKFLVVHEIGHAIQHNYINHINKIGYTKTNVSDHFLSFSTANDVFFNRHMKITQEIFADLFASISLIILDGKNPDLISNLKETSAWRKNRFIGGEVYNTFNSLDTLIKDVENKTFKVNNFNDMYKYINKLINKEVKLHLKKNLESLEKTNSGSEISSTLGYLSGVFNFNAQKLQQYLDKEIDYQYNHQILGSINGSDFFKGLSHYNHVQPLVKQQETEIKDNSLMKYIANKALKVRDTFKQNDKNKNDFSPK